MFSLLVCDDHSMIRTGVRIVANEASGGCDITEVGNSHQLLEALRSRRPFDLLLLDLILPGADGLSLLPVIKSIRSDLPVMIYTATDDSGTVAEALKAGALRHVPKSLTERELFEVFKEFMRGHSSCAAHETRRHDGLTLTARQRDVLECLLRGMPNKQIAKSLGLSEGTIKSHTVAVFRSLNVNSRAEVILEAQRRGLSLG